MNAPAAPQPAAIGVTVERVGKRFRHAVKGMVYAAREVTLDIAAGEFLTLLGPSGCGKTTTLRMIAGFETPDEGRIAFAGQDVTQLPANERGIGFVFQNYALFPHLSVAENVAYGLEVRGQPRAAVARAVGEVLELVGLAGYERQFPAQMSGGEQQRVALARAIVIRPRVLLFDEPLSNLDARLRVQMREEIRALQKRLAITTVYVTHDQEEAMAVSDRIAVMNAGSLVEIGGAEALYHRPRTRFVAEFIGRANLVEALVVGGNGEQLEVEALGQRLTVVPGAGRAAPGSRGLLLLRPEALALAPAGAHDAAVEATVKSRSFLGEKVEYLLDCGGRTLQVVRPSLGGAPRFAPGQRVGLQVLPGAGTLVDAR
ncbi:MAG: ABC transporter ATP-binding protein [Rubrivivax sp.]